jgi:hypothetical protein
MARPREYGKRISTAVRLKSELHERLVVEAEARDLSVNSLINRAISEFLDDLIPVEELVLTRSDQFGRDGETS